MQQDRQRENAENSPKAPDVVVVGAGFAGMYMLHRLRQWVFQSASLKPERTLAERGTGIVIREHAAMRKASSTRIHSLTHSSGIRAGPSAMRHSRKFCAMQCTSRPVRPASRHYLRDSVTRATYDEARVTPIKRLVSKGVETTRTYAVDSVVYAIHYGIARPRTDPGPQSQAGGGTEGQPEPCAHRFALVGFTNQTPRATGFDAMTGALLAVDIRGKGGLASSIHAVCRPCKTVS